MSRCRYYIDYNKSAYACAVEWIDEQHSITILKPFIDYIRCDLDGDDYAFLYSGKGDFREIKLVDFQALGVGENNYILCYMAWIEIDLEHHPNFAKALSFSSNEIEVVIGFKYRDEIVEDCYRPYRDYAVSLIEDISTEQNKKIIQKSEKITKNIGDLKGPILEGKCETVFFSTGDWEKLFKNKYDVKEWLARNCNSEKNFSPTDIVFDGVNNNLLIRKGKKIICYSWNRANGPHPDRWQDSDNLTEWFSDKL